MKKLIGGTLIFCSLLYSNNLYQNLTNENNNDYKNLKVGDYLKNINTLEVIKIKKRKLFKKKYHLQFRKRKEFRKNNNQIFDNIKNKFSDNSVMHFKKSILNPKLIKEDKNLLKYKGHYIYLK